MLTAEIIKNKARELGAVLCGIGDIKYFEGEDIQRDPKSILPNAKCVIGCALPVPKGLYKAMESETQFYTYTSLGVKYIDETFAEIFLLKLGNMIENEGYDAPTFKMDESITDFYQFTKNSFSMENYKFHEFKFDIPMAI